MSKKSSLSRECVFESYITKMCLKKDKALSNLQYLIYYKTKIIPIYLTHMDNKVWYICHKIQPNKILYIEYICIKRIWH